ncbi:hypothetical protein MB828_13465, partial [Streptomyces arenae]|nr:hypothetical protein [Streptomyces arenae]
TPDGPAAPLPAGGQTHTPPPATTTGTLPKTTALKPKKAAPPKSGTSGGKSAKGKKPATVKPTGPDKSTAPTKGKGAVKSKAPLVTPPSGTTPAAPLSPYVAPTGNAVPTPGDGNCLLYAVIGSAPALVRTRLLAADPALDPGLAQWLGRPDAVRQTLTTMTQHPQTVTQGSGHLRSARRELQNLVVNRLAAARDDSRPLPPQVLGQLRGVLADMFATTVENMSDTDVTNNLTLYGIQGMTQAEDLDPADIQTRYLQAVSLGTAPAPTGTAPSNRRMFAYLRAVNALPTLNTMTPDERRALLTAAYHRSTAALTAREAATIDRAVRNWSNAWADPVGDTFLPLLADTLGAPIHVFEPVTATPTGPQGIVLRYGPSTNTPALEVHYTGLNHYSASDATQGAGGPTIITSKAPRGPQDAESVQPDGRHRPEPVREASDDQPATHVNNVAPKNSWHGLRPYARPSVHSAERFDPHADQSSPPRAGVLSGATTLIRTQVRRIQAPNGQWIRDYTVNLPVSTTDPAVATRLNARITRLLDTHLNSGLALPASGDQLHISLNLISDPAHPEVVTLTDSEEPGRADQLHLDVNHSDEDLLHEVLHYLGLPDEQRDNDFLLRNHANSTTVRTTGLMATTQGPVHIPQRYLRIIEDVTASGPQLHDHTDQDETTPAENPDTTPIPTDAPLTWPASHAPTAPTPAPAQLPSSYVNTYGSLPDGSVGLVYAEPFSDEVIEGLHGQVYEALGLDPDDPPESVREQVRGALNRDNLGLQLPYLRSNGGHRITVTVDGRDHTVDVQLTLSDARASLRQGRFDPRDPDKHVERRGFGTRENFSSQPSGTYRTFQVPWTGSWPIEAATAVRAVDGSVTAAVTHNQASDATTVTQAVQTTSAQRSNEPSDPVEFTTRWRVRVDAPAVTAPTTGTAPAADGWGTAESHGPTTIWFPRHLTTADPAPGSLPAPAAPADLPLYGVDSVLDPRALYEHVHQSFHADLDETAAGQVSDFLSEQVLRGTLPMQIDGGIYSPVITDADGNAVGMLHLVTVPNVGTPLRQSTPGQINLESHLVNTAKVDLSSRYTSGIGISGSGAAALTGDHAQGHPNASSVIGGSVGLRGQTQATVTNTYSASSSAGTMHAIRTNRGHLLTPSGTTYQVTLIRPDGTETAAPPLTQTRGMDLRVLSQADANGHPPTPAEVRELPDSLERLDGIGLSAAPLDVTGTDGLFDEAETWLRREGFLPPSPTAPAPTGVAARLKQAARDHEPEHQIRLHAQLNNLRRLREARSRTGLRAATDAMVDGGHALHFEVPNSTDTGVRRVRLLLTAVRDHTQASTHRLVLPGIQVMGLAQMAGSDAEQRGESYGGALGPMGSVSGPLGGWGSIGFGADYQYGQQVTHGDTVGGATGHDQFFIASGQDSHAFTVPVRLALDLYADDGDQPSERFGRNVNQAAAPPPAPTGSGANPVVPAPPVAPTVSGALRLAVPDGRTHVPPAVAAPPAARVDGAPRPANAVDRARLDGTDASGTPRPELVRIPDDALIDTVRGSAAIESAFQRAAADIRNQAQPTPATPATGPILPVTAPAPAAAPQRDGISPLAGHGLTDSTTRAAETRHAAITPGSLVAHGHEVFKNSYVVEGLSLPGTFADGQYSLEIQAVAHHPRLLDTTRQYLETGVSATDSAQQAKSLGKSHQFGGTGVLTQNPPTQPSGPENAAGQGNTGPESDGSVSTAQSKGKPFKGLFNPSARLGYVSRTDTADTLSASTGVNRTPTESGTLHRVVADVTYLVTVRAGSRTLLNGVGEPGTVAPVTFAVDVPDGLQFLMTQGQLARDARWMGSVQGLTPAPAPTLTAPLPTPYTRNRELGLGGVLSVIEYDRPVAAPVPATGPAAGQVPLGPVNPRERRGQVRRELLELVEAEAPGAVTPGHAGYQAGVHSRIAQLTSTPGLRSLPGRGPDGTPRRATTRFHFRHHGHGGERLIEVTLTAVPRRTQNLAAIRGSSTPGSGLEQWQSHTAAGRTTTRASVRQKQLPVTLTTRYRRPDQGPDPKRTDRAAPVFTPQSATSRSARRATTADNRFWLRTDNGADFDGLQYDYVLSVRSALVADWPPNVIGGLLQNGVIAWSDADHDVRRWVDELLARGNPRTRTVPVRLSLRFTGTETNAPTRPATVTAPSVVSGADPRNTVLPGPAPTPYLADAQMFHPVGPTPAFFFDGWAHLETALDAVAPRGGRGWHAQITSVSVEGQAVRLGQLIQAGRVSLDRPRLAADLTRKLPGTTPFEGAPAQPPTIAVTLYNPRRSTHADDVTLDQLHNTTDTVSTAAGADHSFSTAFTELLSGDDDNRQLAGVSVPLAQRQTQPSTFGGTTTGSRRDWLKSGSTSAPANGARGTRSYVVDADVHLLVEGPQGTRHVTGTVTLRVEERDLLGHGLITPAEAPPNIHDLPALVPDWATAEPHTLPERLNSAIPAGSHGVQVWAALGADPHGEHLGRALYAASRTAVLGNRPLELMTRDPQGIRRWEFAPDGALVTSDPDLTTAWTAFHTEAVRLHDATDTLADTPQRLNRLTASLQHRNRAHTDAVDAHARAHRAVAAAVTAHRGAVLDAAASAKAATEAAALVERLKRDYADAQRTVTTLPPRIAQHERDETRARSERRTALARLTQTENTVRAERAAARAAAQQGAQGGQSTAAPTPQAPVTPNAARTKDPAADVADDPRVQTVVDEITALDDTIQRATTQLVADRTRLTRAQHIVSIAPERIGQAEERREEAAEEANEDARAVVRRAENVRIARFREARAQRRIPRAQARIARRNGQLATAVTAQLQAATDQVAATAALPGVSADVQDNAPTPEQSPRTTFATTPPRWPDPDGRPTPLPAAGQTHTPPPATTTTVPNPTTTTTHTPPKKTTLSKPDKDKGKDKGKQPANGKSAGTSKTKTTGTDKTKTKTTGTDKTKTKTTGTDKTKTKTGPAPKPGTTTTTTTATTQNPAAGTTATPPAPLSPYVAPTGNAVQTPGDGNCLLYAVIGSAPGHVATRLRQADPTFDAGTDAWLGQPHLVRQALTTLAQHPQTINQGTAHLRATRRGLQNLVLARLTAARNNTHPLPPQVLGQLRGVLVGRFATAVQNMNNATVDTQLALYGIQGPTRAEQMDPADLQARYLLAVSAPGAPPAPAGTPPSNARMFAYLRALNALPTVATMTPDERRALLVAGYHESTAPITAPEAAVLDHAVRNWSTQWANRVGDAFLPLLADTLGAPIHVFQPMPAALAGTTATGGPRGIVLPYGPSTSVPALEVHYTGLNHYSASNVNAVAAPPTITTSKAPRAPGDAESVQPDGRHRPEPVRDVSDDQPATHVNNPVSKDSWHGLRPYARPAVHSAERFDPHADQSNPPRPGTLSGATTLIRTQVRRIQAPNGQWIRDYTVNLPVTANDPARAQQLNDRITRLLDTHLNSGLALPASGDQLHINLNLISNPAHPEAVTLTDSREPGRADQLHLDVNHSDEDLLHEVLHYLGLPDEQRDNDFLLRNHANSTTVRTTGLMATTQGPVHIPQRYLRIIEDVTASGPQLHDHTGQDQSTIPAQNPDTTPIPTDTDLIWPASHAPAPEQGPETFAHALARLLSAPGTIDPAPTPVWTRAQDPHTALLAWARADVAAHGAPDGAPLPTQETPVPTDVLAEIGALTEELRAQAILQSGTVTVREAGLDDTARLALVLARPDGAAYAATLAALVARDTGRPVVLLGPGELTQRFGPAEGAPLTLYFDDNRFTVNPPAPDND